MPGMDGYEVAEAITGYSKSKNIPIIFLSAVNIDKRFVTKGYASGGLDYVTKPFDPDLLILKVKTFVRLYQQAQELIRVKATLEQKVSERTKELVEINKALESSNSELQQYAYIASHDLQEPLRKILTFSRMIAEKHFNAPSAREPLMDRVIDAAERMRRLINDLLDFSKLAVPSVFKRTSLNKITNAVLSDLEILIAEKGAHIIVEDLPTVEIIGEQLHQAFLNLISNALKFSEKNVRPVIRVYSETIKEKSIGSEPAPDGRYCRIFITDNGIGFEEKYVDKIFTLFQRLHGKAEYEGTGIGLAIVKKIIDKHQGLISARSAAGKGATFIIVLPLEQSPQQPLVAAV
jgi:signal transduction histidine kinase